MKTLLFLLALALSGCSSLDRPDAVYQRTQAGWVDVTPPSRTQTVLNGLAQAFDDFGRGYGEGIAQYQRTHPIDSESEYHSGAIYGPDGMSLYNIGPGGGTIFGPNGQTTIISGF